MTRRRSPRSDRDSGAALVLVIGFMLMIGAISAALVAAVDSSMKNRTALETLRNREYAADAAVEVAITQLRPRSCTSPASFLVDSSVNATSIRVEWQNACSSVKGSDGVAYQQRNVVLAACVDTGSSCAAADVIIHAQVNFGLANEPVTKTVVQSWSVHR